MYNWEASGKNKHKVKKTGTVVLHTDEKIDLTFDRLIKEYIVENDKSESPKNDENDAFEEAGKHFSGKKAPLMTEGTVAVLKNTMGFEGLLPSQAQCYRGIFKGRDVILHSRTGTGKTLAYALPIVEKHLILHAQKPKVGPFLLIFVFSDELAFQTRGVLQKVYGKKLKIGVAGSDDVSAPHDVIIGTVQAIDEVVRGKNAHCESKRPRDDDEGESSDDDDAEELGEGSKVDVSQVSAIVVDEVDTTLGPRFSNIGRRMKNLLKTIRRANGSLSESLLSDFRAHHYVLCGATIPNWVIKAGFLGVKKYYYQLVTVGTEKLPPQLEAFAVACSHQSRVNRTFEIISKEHTQLGRIVVFGTRKELDQLESLFPTIEPPTTKKKNEKPHLSVRSLSPKYNEMERVKAIEAFNSKQANVLLCTDVAARGLDFTDVKTVLMMSLPKHAMACEVFVHRAGRTARVGKPGQCVLLFDDENEKHVLDAIAKNTHIAFRKMTALEPHKESANTKFYLRVKGAFATAAAVPSPIDVLKKSFQAKFDKIVNIEEVESDMGKAVTFEYPTAESHEVTAMLWKFDVKEVKQ